MRQDGDNVSVTARQPEGIQNTGASAILVVPPGVQLDVRTSNGGVTVGASQASVTARTSNGSIAITADSATVNAATSNGNITYQGAPTEANHALHSSNGNLTLKLPAGSRFRIDADTSNGEIRSDFPVTTTGSFSRTRLQGTVGDNPKTALDLRTSNGNIQLSQT